MYFASFVVVAAADAVNHANGTLLKKMLTINVDQYRSTFVHTLIFLLLNKFNSQTIFLRTLMTQLIFCYFKKLKCDKFKFNLLSSLPVRH